MRIGNVKLWLIGGVSSAVIAIVLVGGVIAVVASHATAFLIVLTAFLLLVFVVISANCWRRWQLARR